LPADLFNAEATEMCSQYQSVAKDMLKKFAPPLVYIKDYTQELKLRLTKRLSVVMLAQRIAGANKRQAEAAVKWEEYGAFTTADPWQTYLKFVVDRKNSAPLAALAEAAVDSPQATQSAVEVEGNMERRRRAPPVPLPPASPLPQSSPAGRGANIPLTVRNKRTCSRTTSHFSLSLCLSVCLSHFPL
jgi:hypothetical protein